VDRACPEFLDRAMEGAWHRDRTGPSAAAGVGRAGTARLSGEGRASARVARRDPARADAHRPPRLLAPADRVPPPLAGTGLLAGARVALVHDWLTGMRGGEPCLQVLRELFPDR